MKCYYHNDLDGRCAGAIVKRFAILSQQEEEKYIEMEYSDEVNLDNIKPDETIYIVDFSFKPEIMEKILEKTKNIIWIDHHKTILQYEYSQKLKGLRDINYSGCELTWMYLNPHLPFPEAVKFIGDRDKWAWQYGRDTAFFCMGLMIEYTQPEGLIWDRLLHQHSQLVVNEIINQGKICMRFRDNLCEDYANKYGFETEFEGYKCFALGIYMFGSEAFGNRFYHYDICISYEFLGDKWIVSLYSERVDVSKIAKKYGGGGHTRAAGFVSKDLPF